MKKVLILITILLVIPSCTKKEYKIGQNAFLRDKIVCDESNKPVSGVVRAFYNSGNLSYKAEIQHGKEHGKFIRYYESGNIAEESTFQNGLIHGLTKIYYENGQLFQEATSIDGHIIGLRSVYRQNGLLWFELIHEKPVIDGITLKSGFCVHSDGTKRQLSGAELQMFLEGTSTQKIWCN